VGAAREPRSRDSQGPKIFSRRVRKQSKKQTGTFAGGRTAGNASGMEEHEGTRHQSEKALRSSN